MQKQPPEMFYKKAVFKNFPTFAGKHLCWSLFLISLQNLGNGVIQKQSPGSVLQNRCPYKCPKIHSKTLVSEYLFVIKFNFIEKATLTQLLSREFCEIFNRDCGSIVGAFLRVPMVSPIPSCLFLFLYLTGWFGGN